MIRKKEISCKDDNKDHNDGLTGFIVVSKVSSSDTSSVLSLYSFARNPLLARFVSSKSPGSFLSFAKHDNGLNLVEL